MTKITIVSGFLGSGKTTLINLLLKYLYHDEKCVLIENESGDTSVDSKMFNSEKKKGLIISEINAGCICCSVSSFLLTAIDEILHTISPQRIIIEPSGIARLSDIIQALKPIITAGDVFLEPPIVILGFTKSASYLKQFKSIWKNQIEYAGIIIIRPDIDKNPEQYFDMENTLRAIHRDVPIYHMDWTKEALESYLSPLMATTNIDSYPLTPEHDSLSSYYPFRVQDRLTFYTLHPIQAFTRQQLETIFELLECSYRDIFRLKGFLKNSDNGYWHVEYTLYSYKIEESNDADSAFLNVITSDINRSSLQHHFKEKSVMIKAKSSKKDHDIL